MSVKKKILMIIIGVEAVIIAGIIAFVFYLSSDTVRIGRQMELAQRYLQAEDYEQAVAAFQLVIDIDPKNVEAYLGLAETYITADEYDKAVKILERGVKRTDSEEIQEVLDEYAGELVQESEIGNGAVARTEEDNADMAENVQNEEQNGAWNYEDIYRKYLDEILIPTYGIFAPQQSGTMHSTEEKWLNPAGIMDATILDFDRDGVLEMLVCYTKQYSGKDSYGIHMTMYEISDGKVELASDVPFIAYHEARQEESWNESLTLVEAEWCEMSLNASAVQVNGIYYIVCEAYRLYGTFADGQSQDYWAMTYQNGELQYAFSFTQTGGGSSEFEYTGYEFADGICTNSAIYYNEWYEDEGTALYDRFDSAITAFFDKQGIHIQRNLELYRNEDKGTILLKDENDIVSLFEFVNELARRDFSTSTFDFVAVLSSYGKLSEG